MTKDRDSKKPADSEKPAGHEQMIRRHYEHRISPQRPSHEVLDWASAESQRARFDIFVRHVPLEGKTLLDVGCGLGDLQAYLEEHEIAARYTGVDILGKMVQAASHRNPRAAFVQADIFHDSPFDNNSFDVVFCSGAFNLNLGNNQQFLPTAVARLLALAGEHCVFNLLHHRAANPDRTYFYYDPQAIRVLMDQLNCPCEIIDDYLHNDFTVIGHKK